MSNWAPFALVDGAAAPARSGELRYHAAWADLQCRSLFSGQPEDEHADAAPWLIALPTGAIQRPIHHWMASLGQSTAGVTTLASSVPFEALFQHLQARLDIALPDGSLALMRFYDPRAWLRYCDVLTTPQQLALLGPVLEWQVTVQGQTWSVSRADLERQQEAADAAAER
jgi:hypothetical protein